MVIQWHGDKLPTPRAKVVEYKGDIPRHTSFVTGLQVFLIAATSRAHKRSVFYQTCHVHTAPKFYLPFKDEDADEEAAKGDKLLTRCANRIRC